MLPTILILKGLPGSGKSTYARAMVDKSGGRTVRVNKDDLRAMMFTDYIQKNEKVVVAARNAIISNALDMNRDVIVDDTNLNKVHEINIRENFSHRATIEIKFLDVPIEECIRRDALRTGKAHVGEAVIRRIAKDL